MDKKEIQNYFTRLQRASVVLEVLVATGGNKFFAEAVQAIQVNLDLILKCIGVTMTENDKPAINSTSTPIPQGALTPSNNQGVIPSPVTGSTVGVNGDRSQFATDGKTQAGSVPTSAKVTNDAE